MKSATDSGRKARSGWALLVAAAQDDARQRGARMFIDRLAIRRLRLRVGHEARFAQGLLLAGSQHEMIDPFKEVSARLVRIRCAKWRAKAFRSRNRQCARAGTVRPRWPAASRRAGELGGGRRGRRSGACFAGCLLADHGRLKDSRNRSLQPAALKRAVQDSARRAARIHESGLEPKRRAQSDDCIRWLKRVQELALV